MYKVETCFWLESLKCITAEPNPILNTMAINPINVVANAINPKSSGNNRVANIIFRTIAFNWEITLDNPRKKPPFSIFFLMIN